MNKIRIKELEKEYRKYAFEDESKLPSFIRVYVRKQRELIKEALFTLRRY